MYPIRYLNEFFVPYGSSLETNISLMSMLFISVTYLDFFVVKIYAFSTTMHYGLYTVKKNSKKIFYNNLSIHDVIIRITIGLMLWLKA